MATLSRYDAEISTLAAISGQPGFHRSDHWPAIARGQGRLNDIIDNLLAEGSDGTNPTSHLSDAKKFYLVSGNYNGRIDEEWRRLLEENDSL